MRDPVAVLAEPNRRKLLELLLAGERSVGSLVTHFDVTQSAISQHLGVLARAGLVQARREGRFRYYRVNPAGLAELRASLDVFWDREMQELVAAAPAKEGAAAVDLEKTVLVPLGADETFALLTEPDRLRRWQAVAARIDLRAGGEYRWTIVPGHTAAGKVVEIEAGRRLVLSWGWEDTEDLPPGASTVTITLEPTEGGTRVRLVHTGLTEDQAANHAEGWAHYLDRLSAAAASGDAGADEWAASPEPMDRLSAAEASLAICQQVLRRLTESDNARSTPCRTFTVGQLVDHLDQAMVMLGSAAGGSGTRRGEGHPEERIATAAQQALEVWRRRGLEGEVERPGKMPATMAANILSLELLVHAWDLAQATSVNLEVSEALSEYVLSLANEVITAQHRGSERFDAEVNVGSEASSLERLVAFTGRTPHHSS